MLRKLFWLLITVQGTKKTREIITFVYLDVVVLSHLFITSLYFFFLTLRIDIFIYIKKFMYINTHLHGGCICADFICRANQSINSQVYWN